MEVGTLRINLSLEDGQMTASLGGVTRKLKAFEAETESASRAVNRLDRNVSSLGSTFAETIRMMGFARFALLDIYDVFFRLPMKILETTGELERMTQVMYGLSTASTETARRLEGIAGKQFVIGLAKNAPYDIKNIQDAFIKLKSGGIDPTNGSLTSLIDSVSKFGGTSQQLDRAAVALQQMSGKGVISMEELRQQLGEAVPTAMRMMAFGAGMSMSELVKHVSKGEVGSKEALRRLFIVMKLENEGAAKEMMNTWVGLTSRIKTEWDLLQEAVGNSGFMDAMKDVGGELLAFMKSPEARAWAKELGAALGAIVFALRDLIKGMYDYAGAIKAAAVALGAYLVASRAAAAFNTLKGSMGRVAADMAAVTAGNNTRLAAQKAQMAIEADMQRARLARMMETNAAELAAQEAHLARLRAARDRHEAALKVAEARYAIDVRGRHYDPENGRKVSNQAVANNVAEQIVHARNVQRLNEQIAAQDRLREATKAAGDAHQAAGMAIISQANNVQKATGATNFLATATRGASFAMGLLGGPIGAITLAVTLGYLAWEKWGNASEKAIQKLRDELARGFVTPEALAGQSKVIADKQKDLERQDAIIAARTDRINNGILSEKARDAELVVLRDAMATRNKIAAEINMLSDQNRLGRAQVVKQDAERQTSEYKTELEKRFDAERAALTASSNAQRKAAEDKIKLMKATGEAADKITKAAEDKIKQDSVKFYADRVAMLEAEKAKFQSPEARRARMNRTTGTALSQDLSEREVETLLSVARQDLENMRSLQTPMKLEGKKEIRDPMNDAIARSLGDLKKAMTQADDLKDGIINFNEIKKSIVQEIEQNAKAGMYDKEDGKGGKIKFDIDERMLDIDLLAQNLAHIRQENLIRQATVAGLKMEESTKEALVDANQRLANSGDKLDVNYLRAQKALAKMRVELGDAVDVARFGTKTFQEFSDGILGMTGNLGLSTYMADLAAKTEQLQALDEDGKAQRMEREYQRLLNHERRMFEARKQNARMTAEELQVAERLFAGWQEAFRADHVRKMRTPIEQMAVDWKNTTNQMNQSTAKWMNDSTEEVLKFTTGAKTDFRALAVSILTDIARISLRKNIAEPMSEFFSGLGKGAAGVINGDKTAAGQGFSGMIGGVVKFGKDLFEKISPSAKTVAEGLWAVSDGTEDVVAQTAQELLKGATKMSAEATATASITSLGMAANQAAFALANISTMSTGSYGGMGGLFGGGADPTGAYASLGVSPADFLAAPFANGGIMTSEGPMELRKYAMGGIANRPQLAMFGEGSMPEAFVPLPDGRSIPVQMRSSGEGSGGVQINITVHQNGQTSQSASGNASQYEGLAQKIKAIVRSELIDQKRPNGILAQ